MICVSLARTRHKMMIAEHQQLAQRGAELVELRLDYLQRIPNLGRILNGRPTPVIVTCRRKEDQGRWNLSEEDRLMVLRSAIVAGVEYVDLEVDVATRIRRYGKTKRIVSWHNFQETPDDLEARYAEMCKLDADIVKIVTFANSPKDCVRMLKLVRQAKVPTVGFCMGEFGAPSRILCGKYGSPFTYATFSRDREVAPGQLVFEDMARIYQYNEINAQTKVFGVLGDPIGHSLSPRLHNAAFKDFGINAVYLPIRVTPEQLPSTLAAFEWLEVGGYSVTIPHKEAVLKLFPNATPMTEEIGAANTLYRDPQGKWRTDNTDFIAALEAIQTAFLPGEGWAGKKALMLGAGGAARAVGLGIVRNGAELTIASRTLSRSKGLAQSLGAKAKAIDWDLRDQDKYDILVNCTPVGMHPNVDESPYPQSALHSEMIVFDSVYTPEHTQLIKDALQHHCRIVTGVEMFVRQASAQFEKFTGQRASLSVMAETLRRAISPAKYDDPLAGSAVAAEETPESGAVDEEDAE